MLTEYESMLKSQTNNGRNDGFSAGWCEDNITPIVTGIGPHSAPTLEGMTIATPSMVHGEGIPEHLDEVCRVRVWVWGELIIG